MPSMKCTCGQLNWVNTGAGGSCVKCSARLKEALARKGPTTAVLEAPPPIVVQTPLEATLRAKKGSLVEDTLGAFAWGLQGLGPLFGVWFYSGGALLAMILASVAVGMWGGLTGFFIAIGLSYAWYYGYQTALSFQIVQSGALRSDEFPSLPPMFSLDTSIIPFFQMLSWTLFVYCVPAAMVAASLYFHKLPLLIGAVPVALLLTPIYFLGYIGLSMHDSLFGLSPIAMVKTLLRRPESIGFVMVMLFLTTIAAVVAAFGVDLFAWFIKSFWIKLGLRLVGLFIALYFTAVFGRMLGILQYHHGDDLKVMRE